MPHIGPLADFGEPEGLDGEDAVAPEAALFVRPVPTRPALPWDQARAAALEARLNAPLPIGELAWQIKRLESWKPGSPSRFVAIYARREDVREGLSSSVDIEGREIRVQFPSPGRRREQVRRLAAVGTGAGLAAFLLVSSVISVLAVRARATAQLVALEQTTARRLEQTRVQKALQTQAQAIAAAGLDERRASRVLNDLAWAARNKTPDAGVEGFFWESSLFAVEVRGEISPFETTDRRVERSTRPVRPGVWLWGVTDTDASAGAAP